MYFGYFTVNKGYPLEQQRSKLIEFEPGLDEKNICYDRRGANKNEFYEMIDRCRDARKNTPSESIVIVVDSIISLYAEDKDGELNDLVDIQDYVWDEGFVFRFMQTPTLNSEFFAEYSYDQENSRWVTVPRGFAGDAVKRMLAENTTDAVMYDCWGLIGGDMLTMDRLDGAMKSHSLAGFKDEDEFLELYAYYIRRMDYEGLFKLMAGAELDNFKRRSNIGRNNVTASANKNNITGRPVKSDEQRQKEYHEKYGKIMAFILRNSRQFCGEMSDKELVNYVETGNLGIIVKQAMIGRLKAMLREETSGMNESQILKVAAELEKD